MEASQHKIDNATLIDYGSCYLDVSEEQVAVPNSPTGYFYYADSIFFSKKSDIISAKKGVKFGISYRLGTASGEKELLFFDCQIHHPKLTNSVTQKSFTETSERKSGWSKATGFDYYTLEYDWEVVSGIWMFQIVQDHRIFIQKKFTIIQV